MTIATLIDSIPAGNGPVSLHEAEGWMQGRTLYGGASALLAYTAVRRTYGALPPLRAAQIGFVAPLGQSFTVHTTLVREGRNVTQIRSELLYEDKVALTAFWLFGAERAPNALHTAPDLQDWPGPAENAEPVPTGKGPTFIQNNFEMRWAQDRQDPGVPLLRRWARLREGGVLDPVSELILMGDVLPPGAARAMQRQGAISSMNWSFNILDPQPSTQGGWWLNENASTHADHGYSSERLRLWNGAGRQVMDGLQCAAIFG